MSPSSPRCSSRASRFSALRALALLLVSAASLPAQVTVTGLTGVGSIISDRYSYSTAVDINDSGLVIITQYDDNVGYAQAFLRASNGSLTNLGTLGGNGTYVYGLNTSGDVVGSGEPASGPSTGYIRLSGNSLTAIPNTLGGTSSSAHAVNDSGQVVGTATNGGGYDRAYIWTSGGGMVGLSDPLDGSRSGANHLNASGQVAGYVLRDDEEQAARWASNGSLTVISRPSGWLTSKATAINSAGHVVGRGLDGDENDQAFYWDGVTTTALGTLAGDLSAAASDINNLGHIVGYSESDGGDEHAFLYVAGTMYDLNTLAATFLSDGSHEGFMNLGWASSLNEAGQIVGHGTYFDGTATYQRGFVLNYSAIPEPSTYAALFGATVLGFALYRRHRRTLPS